MNLVTGGMKERGLIILIGLCLAILTAAVYWQVGGFEFVRLDDDKYITENPIVRNGLSLEGIRWAFTTLHAEFWHPLTWLSHMLDGSLYGSWAGGHHFSNLLLHLANTVLLFLFLATTTGANGRSAVVVALFALHPLHVESVAWVSERKDVLSTFFFVLTLLAYAKYVRTGRWPQYCIVVLLFILSLLAKPMYVTLPFILMLLDIWPLKRFNFSGPEVWRRITPLFKEKIPLLLFSVLFGIVAIIAQMQSDPVAPLSGGFPLWVRMVNAMASYGDYLVMTVWPSGLVPFYPHPEVQVSFWKAGLSFAMIAAAALCAWRRRSRQPYLLVGLLWYLITLMPVIGLLQVGLHAMADRYTYIPLVGIFILAAWGMTDLVEGRSWGKAFLAVTTCAVLVALTILTWVQVGHWQDSMRLFQYIIQVNPENGLAHNNLGALFAGQGRLEDANRHYNEALRIKPDDVDARYNLANILARQAKVQEAIVQYREVLRIVPDYVMARNNLALCLIQTGDRQAAIEQFQEILRVHPEFEAARQNLSMLLAAEAKTKRPAEEMSDAGPAETVPFEESMRLGQEAVKRGDLDSAAAHFRRAVRSNPGNAGARIGLGLALAYKGDLDGAIRQFRAALRLDPNNADVHNSLGVALMQKGQLDEARTHLQKAIQINPRMAKAHNSLGVLLARKGQLDEAMEQFREALRIDPSNQDAEKNLALVQNMKARSK